MKRIKVDNGNMPTICDRIRKMVLAAGNVNFFEKPGVMSHKQIKAAMMPGNLFLESVGDVEGYLEVGIVQSIFGGDRQISISKKIGSRFRCSGILSTPIIPGDYLIINCFGIAIIRKNYNQFVSFAKH